MGALSFLSTTNSLVSAVAEVVVPALEATAPVAAAAAITTVFPGFGYGYADGPSIDRSAVQFLHGFLCSCIIRHLDKRKTAGFAGEFVGNDLGGRNFSV